MKGSVTYSLPPDKDHQSRIIAEVDSTSTALCWAGCWLGSMAPLVPRPAIVLDIDGTILHNLDSGKARCVLGFRKLSEACEEASIAIFVVTARPKTTTNTEYTLRQLEKCGIKHLGLFMKPTSAEYESYKWRARQKIRRMGYSVLLSIGDQFADLRGPNDPPLPRQISDRKVYVGTLGDAGSFAIKLVSEFE